jgi:hypothetical protein
MRLRNAWGDGALGGVMGFQARPKIGQPSPFSNPHMGYHGNAAERSDRRMGHSSLDPSPP